jgi:peptidoglycan/xylan/chitin deacetylase (PgdA/CDA1 family)
MNWPSDKPFAVFVNVAFEGWRPGHTPGVSPMGNPLPAGMFDTQARSWGDYGFQRGVWRLLDILREHAIRATFLTSGVLTELAPEAVAAAAEQGHAICAHGWSQGDFPSADEPRAERSSIVATRDALSKVSGAAPRGWMSPRGTCSVNTVALLAEEGFSWFGDAFDEDMGYVGDAADPIVTIPFTMEINDLPLRMKHGLPADQFEISFDQMLAATRRFADGDLHLDVTVHTHLSGRPVGAYYFERVLEKVNALSDAWIATRDEAAEHLSRTLRGQQP